MGTRIAATSHPLRRGIVAAAFLVLAWGLVGCSSGAEDSSGASAGALGYEGGGQEEPATDGGTSSGSATGDRSLIVTGTMYMTVEDPMAAADDAQRIVEGAGGRIDSRSETAPGTYDGGSAQLTLRIPAARLDPVVDDLRGLGTVDEFSTDSADVTTQVQDLDAEISTLRASTARIEALLADAADIKDIITLENELDDRQARLESLEARQRGLADQVAMSTIDLSLTTEPVVLVDDSPRSFWGGLVSGWNALMTFLAGTLVIVGVLLPWLALVALVGAVSLALVRARRARKQTVEPPAPQEPVASGPQQD
ncbi:DUF4349 domain-containing protein [Demequina soli]|uniref:DUF4349 domain-containing protein n=1 Tax=Demequina soli TaxID=1638987 RepID=UPI0007860A96|nr:DUF4349 domain-containing protein [Demequina soli]